MEHLNSRSGHDHIALQRGDKLVLYTDGLFEVFGSSGAILGVEGLKEILSRGRERNATDLSASLVEEVETFRERPRKDDVSFLVLELTSPTRSRPSRKGVRQGTETADAPARTGEEEVRVTIPSQARYLRPLRALVSRVAQEIGFPEVETRELVLSIDEACSNIIKHAYKGAPDGTIEFILRVSPESIVVELRDRGEKISPSEIQGRELKDVKPGGLGTHFMRCCMDRVEFDTSSDRGNILRMTKRR
jgi:anti-sigma regulatory factor (Ser/Thr protein kinase)